MEVKPAISHKTFSMFDTDFTGSGKVRESQLMGEEEEENTGVLGGLESPGEIIHQWPKRDLGMSESMC